MPGWNIHLEAGTRLAKKLKLSGIKRKEFLLGCLLPDINNGYINKVKTRKHHKDTHYVHDQKSSLNFYAENKAKVDTREPIFLGYLLHLYTDGFFNYDFYRTIKRHPLGKNLDYDSKQEIKQHDFWLYDTNFDHHLNLKNHSEAVALAPVANHIPAVEIVPEDIEDIERVLNDENFKSAMLGEKYKFYTKKRLDQLMEDMLESFAYDYMGEDYA